MSKFKVGDRVRRTRLGCCLGKLKQGEIYVVTEVLLDSIKVNGIELPHDGNGFELVEEDNVNSPSHYNSHPSGVECITITEGFNFNVGNAVKYLWRAGLKNHDAIEDLQKAKWYVEREIERLS